jgi:hypothetical protein
MDTDGVVVVMAYHEFPGEGQVPRRESMHAVDGFYRSLGLPVVIESRSRIPGLDGKVGRFTRARAINAGVRRARAAGATIIVQSDPDSLVSEAQLATAIEVVRSYGLGLVVPFTRYCYLTAQWSRVAIRNLPGKHVPNGWGVTGGMALYCDEMGSGGVGNVTVFNVDTWVAARGLDERFPLWGGDDVVFAHSCEAMTGVPTRRVEGDMFHLWHPRLPQSVPGHPLYAQQFSIVAEYRDAVRHGPDAIRELVEARPPVD